MAGKLTSAPPQLRRGLALAIPALTAIALYLAIDLVGRPSAREESFLDSESAGDRAPNASPQSHALEAFTPLLTSRDVVLEAYSTKVRSQRFDTTGLLQYSIATDSQIQLADQSALLEMPRVVLYEDGTEEWRVGAQFGRVEQRANSADTAMENNLLRFLGDARLHAAEDNPSQLIVQSPSLLFDARNETLSSEDSVRVTERGLSQDSQGFDADLQTDTMHFHSSVRGTYDSPQ